MSPTKITSNIFGGLAFFVPDQNADTVGTIKTHGGKVLRGNDNADETICIIQGDSKRKLKFAEDEFAENQWKVSSAWVMTCAMAGRLLPFETKEESYVVGKPPAGVANPVFAKLSQEFTPEDDESLKQYAMESAKKGWELTNLAVWEFVTRQKRNPLSRFTAQQLQNRFVSFGEEKSPSKSASTPRARQSVRASNAKEEDVSASAIKQRLRSSAAKEEPKRAKVSEDSEEDSRPQSSRKKVAKKAMEAKPAAKSNKGKSPTGGKAGAKAKNAAIEDEEEDEDEATAVKYSREEDQRMIEFAMEHPTLSQSEMWALAAEEKLLPGRTAVSMRKHYRKLDEKLNRTQPVVSSRAKNFSAQEDHELFRWLLKWKEVMGREGVWGMGIWQMAESNQVLPGRTAEQMFNRFHNSLRKRMDEGLAMADADDSEPYWEPPVRNTPLRKGGSASPMPTFKPSQLQTATSTSAPQNAIYARPHEVEAAVDLVKRVQESVKSKALGEIFRALYFTCGDEQAAIRVLTGQDPDSKYEIWTSQEDKRLTQGETLDRPDAHRRRIFLGLETRGGL